MQQLDDGIHDAIERKLHKIMQRQQESRQTEEEKQGKAAVAPESQAIAMSSGHNPDHKAVGQQNKQQHIGVNNIVNSHRQRKKEEKR